MKKTALRIFIFLFIISLKLISQPFTGTIQPLSGGIFDKVFDRFGKEYNLANLTLDNMLSSTGVNSAALPTQSCSAGYFTVYYAPGSYWTLNAATQSVMCQVLTDISTFINSPLSVPGNTVKINLYCDDLDPTSITNNVLGNASPIFIMPTNPTNPNQGVADSQIYKAIVSGQNPYASLPVSFAGYSEFYYGYIKINPSTSWHLNTNVTSINSGSYDFYTIFLHEVLHALGFMSLIDENGISKFGPDMNFFSRYDLFLTNSSGSPLLASTAPLTCPTSSLSFQGSLSSISQSVCPGTNGTCSLAARYNSSNVNVPLYTPECFSEGSSLSHFNDLCQVPPGYANTCSTSANPANTFNGLYYVMTAGVPPGSCFVKRYPKEEERFVLCDMGYSVNGTYNSIAAAASHTYGAGSACSGTNIWGANDGLVNGIYTFTAAAGINTLSIPITGLNGILSNDATAASTICCVEEMYNNATVIIAGTNLVITAGTNVSGLILIKYYPQTSGGDIGNATYVYAYFLPANCSPANPCNMVQNGGFENIDCGAGCGGVIATACNPVSPKLSCWDAYSQSPDLFTRNCSSPLTGAVAQFNLGVATLNMSPTLDSFNGSPNDKVLGMGLTESIINNLSSPLIHGQAYQLSLYAYNNSNNSTYFGPMNTNQGPVVITVASVQGFGSIGSAPFPNGLNILAQYTVNTINTWTPLTHTFVFSPAAAHNAILIGIDPAQTAALNPNATSMFYQFIDEVSLMPLPTPTFAIPNANICGITSFTDLAQYASPVPGSFSGVGVSTITAGAGLQYDFNAAATLTPGTYPIAFTYTAANGCVNTLYQSVSVQPAVTIPITTSLSMPIYCSNGSGAVISATSATSGNYVWQPGNLYGATQTISPLSTTVYTVSLFTSSCTAIQTVTQTVVTPTLNLSGSGSSSVCPGGSVTLTATGNYTSVTWAPGGVISNTLVVTPTITTVYTVTANSLCPAITATITVPVIGISGAISPLASYTLSSGTYTGTHVFNNDIVIPAGVTSVFNGEFLFAPNIKITVNDGGYLVIDQAHLYACGADMWQGIVIDDGGKISAGDLAVNNRFNLIEDAITAIDMSNHTTSTLTTIIDIAYTTFNKNLTDINIANYQRSTATYSNAVRISNTIFTCRNLPFSSTSWPVTSQSSPTHLRFETSSATGLAPPYLGQSTYSLVNLKNPYSYRGSQTAIKVTGVGTSTNNAYYGITIGNASSYSYFNLFDAHCTGIAALNSNVKSVNNVFQNAKRYAAPVAPGSTLTAIEGGTGIESVFTSTMVGNLDLQATSASTGNRFWNCHTGVSGKKLYGFDIRYAAFRSTQSRITAPGAYGDPGNVAINLNTSRFKYYMYGNEFTNIKNAINIPIVAGPPACMLCAPGIYAANITVLQNTFSPGPGTNNYMDQALNITCANGMPVAIAPSTATDSPGGSFATGVMIEYNHLNDVLRGIYVQGITGFRTHISQNEISLRHDDSYANQHGIDLSNHKDGGISTGVGRIVENTVSGSGATMANTQVSLIYNSLNQGICSPSISCNEVKSSYQGFVFSGLNTVPTGTWGTRWLSNDMSDLKRGMVLANLGRIGQQGAINYGTGNSWNGSWTGSNGIYTENSYANQSTLYTSGSTAPAFPPNLDGFPNPISYAGAAGSILSTTVASYFSCSEPEQFIVPEPDKYPGYGSADVAYMADMGLYWLLKHNDSIRAANSELYGFYTGLAGSNIDLLLQTEAHLYAGNYLSAGAILSSITGTNTVENNYKSFYGLYASYLQNMADSSGYSLADSTALADLAQLCPAYNGACIYQARALRNAIYNTVNNYEDCLDPGKARLVHYSNGQQSPDAQQSLKAWDVGIFPNPAKDQLNIVSKTANDNLHISISDLTGRTMMQQAIKAIGFIANLDLSLANGAYFITITNHDKKTITKKLIIAK